MDEVQVVVRRAEPYVGITESVTMAEIPRLADRLPEVFAHLERHDRAPAGPPFFRYHVIDMERELVLEIGVPTGTPIEGDGEITPGEVPAGRYAAMTHVGAPDTLVAATADLLAWADAEQLTFDTAPSDAGERWGARLELLLSGPVEDPDPSTWVTQLAFRLAD